MIKWIFVQSFARWSRLFICWCILHWLSTNMFDLSVTFWKITIYKFIESTGQDSFGSQFKKAWEVTYFIPDLKSPVFACSGVRSTQKLVEIHNSWCSSERSQSIFMPYTSRYGANSTHPTSPVFCDFYMKYLVECQNHSHGCYSTLTCKVLLNRPHSKFGQHCTFRCLI